MPIQTSYTAARANLAELLDAAVADREIVLIRRRGAADAALIAADELESLLETVRRHRSELGLDPEGRSGDQVDG